jgi:Concanavalin A-like lectin/glucanases superfamily
MAVQYSNAKIVTNGLVLALDAADRNSYVSGSTTWYDLSGNNNSGSLTNNPGFVNNALTFNGTNNTVAFNNIPGPSFSLISSSFTTEFWAYTTTGSNQCFISSNQSSTNGGQYAFVVRASFVYCAFYGSPTYTDVSAGPVITGSWVHYVNTFNYTNQSASIYVNGVLTGAGSMAPSPLITSASLILGQGSFGAGRLTGSMGLARIYNRALSQAEVTQNYNAKKSRFNLT